MLPSHAQPPAGAAEMPSPPWMNVDGGSPAEWRASHYIAQPRSGTTRWLDTNDSGQSGSGTHQLAHTGSLYQLCSLCHRRAPLADPSSRQESCPVGSRLPGLRRAPRGAVHATALVNTTSSGTPRTTDPGLAQAAQVRTGATVQLGATAQLQLQVQLLSSPNTLPLAAASAQAGHRRQACAYQQD